MGRGPSLEDTRMDVRNEFEALIKSLAEYFEAEPAAASVNTLKFGTLSREQVFRLATLITEAGR